MPGASHSPATGRMPSPTLVLVCIFFLVSISQKRVKRCLHGDDNNLTYQNPLLATHIR